MTPTVYTTGFGDDATQIRAKLYEPRKRKERRRKAIKINIHNQSLPQRRMRDAQRKGDDQ